MKEVEKIIESARKEMWNMLRSVYNYNSSFAETKKQEKLLERIVFAMSLIDRKFFVPNDEIAYIDNALPIGGGQTISQPSTVARMLLLAELSGGDDVLEVGSGSGWNASLIAFLVYPGSVVSVERLNKLKEKAEKNLFALREHLKQNRPEIYQKVEKINFLSENIFSKRRVWKKKYDKIIVTAGIPNMDVEKKVEMLAGQLLKRDGVLICPYTSGPILIYKKINEKIRKTSTGESYVFVPLLE